MREKFTIASSVLEWIEDAISIITLPEEAQTIFSKWKKESSAATFTEISKFSKASHIPFGYFFLSTPPEEKLSLIEHRTVNSTEFENPSRNFIDTYYFMKDIQEWTRDYLKTNEVEPLKFVGSMRGESYQKILLKIRNLLHLDPDKPVYAANRNVFNSLRNMISDLGVLVLQNSTVKGNTHRPLDLNEFRGFTLIDQRAPLIFINGRDSISGKTFTLLHEFVHICMGADDLFNKSDVSSQRVRPDEVTANKVASEILLPSQIFLREWKKLDNQWNDYHKISELAKVFKNSEVVVARKALDSGLISGSVYNSIAENVSRKFEESRGGGGDYYRTALARTDKNFLSYLNDSVLEGATSYTEAFRLTATTAKTYPQLIQMANMEAV